MTMKRVNVQFEEDTYKKIKSVSFLEDKSFAEIVREGMDLYLKSKKKENSKMALVLEAEDQKKILEIIAENDYISQEEFEKKHGFKD